MRLAARWAPPRLSGWAEAMAREAEAIERPGAALAFALGCLGWAAREAAMAAMRDALAWRCGVSEGGQRMTQQHGWRPRAVALACAVGATGLGLVYLASAGAPAGLMTMNAAALVAGLVIVLPFGRREPLERPFVGVVAVAIGLALLLTAGLGVEVGGARRWLSVGGVVLQPSLIALPVLIVGFARSGDLLTAAGAALAALALAWQPDRAMAGALVAGVGAVVLVRRQRLDFGVFLLAAMGFAAACVQPDVVPATPFVDRVFRTALSSGPAAGLAVWGGAAMLLVPPLLGLWRDRAHGAIHAAFGATWLAIVFAALVGDYPTPLVGYGGSAIVGYVLATLALPRRGAGWFKRGEPIAGAAPRRLSGGPSDDLHLVGS